MADIPARLRIRQSTSVLWASTNPILALGEPAYEVDTKRFRIGDGITSFTALPFFELNSRLPASLVGRALHFLRVNASETSFETRTPAQLLADLGVTATAAEINAIDGVTSTGTAVIQAADPAAARSAIGAAAPLGFTPVEQGGGTDMGTNKVRIGWRTDGAGLQAQVDATVIGVLATKADIAALPAVGLDYLGAIATTSGSTQTLSGLNLTPYRQIMFVVNGVNSTNAIAVTHTLSVAGCAAFASPSVTNATMRGDGRIDLATGVGSANIASGHAAAPSGAAANPYALRSSLTTASTSISISTSQTFNGGNVLLYGVK